MYPLCIFTLKQDPQVFESVYNKEAHKRTVAYNSKFLKSGKIQFEYTVKAKPVIRKEFHLSRNKWPQRGCSWNSDLVLIFLAAKAKMGHSQLEFLLS